jgi:hypothetical protein
MNLVDVFRDAVVEPPSTFRGCVLKKPYEYSLRIIDKSSKEYSFCFYISSNEICTQGSWEKFYTFPNRRVPELKRLVQQLLASRSIAGGRYAYLPAEEDYVHDDRITDMICLAMMPEGPRIDSLAKQPPEKAVPAIIDFFADPNGRVRRYAQHVLLERLGKKAKPYLAEALASKNKAVVVGALSVIGDARWLDFKQEVRKAVWSADEFEIQTRATQTLDCLRDIEGLRTIAKRHPEEGVRSLAETYIGLLEEHELQLRSSR